MVRLVPVRVMVPPFAAAQTWGRTIFVRRHYAQHVTLIAHELVHVERHWGRWGWRFPFVYLWAWARCGFRYSRIPFESEAYEHQEDEYFQAWARKVIAENSR